jgi:hypothetical protein
MELEGIINHTLQGLGIKKSTLEEEVKICEESIENWFEIRRLHSNDEIRNILERFDNIPHFVSDPDNMKQLISTLDEEPLLFRDFKMSNIHFYLRLRHSCSGKSD